MATATVVQKPWYQSMTVWFNIITVLASMADIVMKSGFTFVTHPLFLTAVGVINFALRFKSQLPIGASAKMVEVEHPDPDPAKL